MFSEIHRTQSEVQQVFINYIPVSAFPFVCNGGQKISLMKKLFALSANSAKNKELYMCVSANYWTGKVLKSLHILLFCRLLIVQKGGVFF